MKEIITANWNKYGKECHPVLFGVVANSTDLSACLFLLIFPPIRNVNFV